VTGPMLTPPQSDVAGVVASLSPAQRKWLPEFTQEPVGFFPIGMSKITRRRLAELGLITMERPVAFGVTKSRLTPLGLAARAYLSAQSRTEGGPRT